MHFRHSPDVWDAFPQLAAGVLVVDGVDPLVSIDEALPPLLDRATARIAGTSEGELPEIRAWRRAFSQMGLKPTQYRCAAEALLRRLRNDGSLPRIHPLVDLCNAVSVAFAIPVAVIDRARVDGDLEVRHADGTERYLAFSGEVEHPAIGEVVYVDGAGNAHARRWTNRQSAVSAIHPETNSVLIVAEALHPGAQADVTTLVAELTQLIGGFWSPPSAVAVLSRDADSITVPASRP